MNLLRVVSSRFKVKSIVRMDILNNTMLFMLAVIIMVGIFVTFLNKHNYYPLKFDTPQNVLREPSVFHLDEPVVVEATFLNEDSRVVTFGGAVHWQLISPNTELLPAGTEVVQFQFTSSIAPGCREFRFENHPPKAVVDTTNRLFENGHTAVTWKLTGDNIILEPKPGSSVRFEVEQFDYIPNHLPLPDHRDKNDNSDCSNVSM